MGFGAFGKDLRLRGGGFFGSLARTVGNVARKIGGAVNTVTTAVKPFVGTVAGIADAIKPGAGDMINTGFNIADGISGSLKGAGKESINSANRFTNRFDKSKQPTQFKGTSDWGVERPKVSPGRGVKVDSILRNPIKRAPIYKPSSASEEETEEETE